MCTDKPTERYETQHTANYDNTNYNYKLCFKYYIKEIGLAKETKGVAVAVAAHGAAAER